MTPTEHCHHLAQALAGRFQNREQALAQPAWFVHFTLWIYPIELFAEDSYTFFLEQASAVYAQKPYRQRIMRVRSQGEDLTAEYYALQNPLSFQGATQASERLHQLTVEDLQPLTGSRLKVMAMEQPGEVRYEARHLPGERCQFEVNGEKKVVELGFDAIAPTSPTNGQAAFWMYDKGIDPETGKATWGALHGAFQLIKVEDFASLLSKG
jgi:hypothetical protein